MKAAEIQRLKSLPKVSHPQNGGVGAGAHFCLQSSWLFPGFAAGLGGLGQDNSCQEYSGHQAAWEGLRFPLSGGRVPFLALCPSYVNFMHDQHRATTEDSLTSVFIASPVSYPPRCATGDH